MNTLHQWTQLKYSLSMLLVAYWTERLVPQVRARLLGANLGSHNPRRMAVNRMRCAERKSIKDGFSDQTLNIHKPKQITMHRDRKSVV